MRQEMAAELDQEAAEAGIAANVRVALLTDGSPIVTAAVQSAYQYLTAAGHPVVVMSPDDFQELSSLVPTVVLLYSSAGPEAMARVCGEVKSACAGQPVVIGAVLPPGVGSQERDAAIRRDLRVAGADAVLTWHGSTAELEAQVDLLAQIMSLQLVLAGAREDLAEAARLDSTTRLLNRRSFFRAAQRECSRARRHGRPLACLMIGIDYFEHFNKKFGDACGDYLLSAVADALRKAIRETDIAARFSDKKMVVLLPETDIDGAAVTREKLGQIITASKFDWQGQTLPVSISIGEVERRWDQAGDGGVSTPAGKDEDDGVPVRLEVAELLEAADVALSIARKGAHCPDIFIEGDLDAMKPAQIEA